MSIIEPQCLEYYKSVFLEIQKCADKFHATHLLFLSLYAADTLQIYAIVWMEHATP